jgi:putative DNA primase/helicase
MTENNENRGDKTPERNEENTPIDIFSSEYINASPNENTNTPSAVGEVPNDTPLVKPDGFDEYVSHDTDFPIDKSLDYQIKYYISVQQCLRRQHELSITPTVRPYGRNPLTKRLEFTPAENDIQDGKNVVCRQFAQTDLGNSKRFIYRHGDNCKYVGLYDKWYVWNGLRWEQDDLNIVPDLVCDTIIRIGAEATLNDSGVGQNQHLIWGGKSQSRERLNAALKIASSSLSVSPDEFDADPYVINFPNGTLNLRTYEFRAQCKQDNITKITKYPYDPTAKCPMWIDFLNRIMMKDQDMIKFIQRSLGYSITGDSNERAMFMCHGSGSNGKSTLFSIVGSILGDFAISVDSDTFCVKKSEGARNDIARLKGSRFVITSENRKGRHLDELFIKSITGGTDLIIARFLYGEFFQFKPMCKIWWAFNSAPRISDRTNSIWNRVKMIPFLYTIPKEEEDIHFADKLLRSEAAGIMNWILDGLKEYQRIGLSEPQRIKTATLQYREEQDILNDFFDDYCVIEPNGIVKAKELYEGYQKWVAFQSINEKPMSPRAFGFEMTDRGYKRDKLIVDKETYQSRVYLGLRFKTYSEGNMLYNQSHV